MLHFIVLLLAFVVPYTQQQQSSSIATCQQVANQTVFKQCVSSVLGVKGTMGSQIASDQVGACYTQLNNGTAYQRCLCAKTSAILGWYALSFVRQMGAVSLS